MSFTQILFRLAAVAGAVGTLLMCASFIMTVLRRGWYSPSIEAENGPNFRPYQQRLMFAGVSLCMIFIIAISVLMLLPGGVPDLITYGESASRRLKK